MIASAGAAAPAEAVPARGSAPDAVGIAQGLFYAATGVWSLVDGVYVARRRISPVYLLDAAAELGLVAAWGLALRGRGAGRNDEPGGGRTERGPRRNLDTSLAGAAR